MLQDTTSASTTLVLAVLLSAAIASYVWHTRQRLFEKLPGPPSTSWLLGNARDVFSNRWALGEFPEPGLSWLKQYGPVYHYRVLHMHRVAIADPVALKHILVTKARDFPRNTVSRIFLSKLFRGVGLLSAEGDTHAAMRRTMNPHFAHTHLKTFVPIFTAHTHTLLSQLEALAGTDTPVNLYTCHFTKLTLDIIGVAAFGYEFGALSGNNIDAYTDAKVPATFASLFGMTFIPGYSYLPLPGFARRRLARDELMATVLRVIEAKMAAPIADPPKDIIDRILAAGPAMTAAEARVHVFTFMQAGHETTSNTLCWIVAHLSKHPEIEAAVRAECISVLARHPDGMTWEGLGELPLLTAVIQETLRICPTVTNLAARGMLKDEAIPFSDGSEIVLPKARLWVNDAMIWIDTAAIHRNPAYWSRPDEFIPERFIEGSPTYVADKELRGGKATSFHYFPFSTGEKNCIGHRFATMELQVVLVHVLASVRFEVTAAANLHPKRQVATVTPMFLETTVHRVG
ncbi:hypothetical protein ACHHYP_11086 [Achlya hypogyna]|uniref:Cytochrome P450 n=1 Tax=Achlya hypogyna TaxID=1202772 RepID=A0A1V9YK05_ACHHY|nr:hypothetical protein ACHHYP_11086 [Achlya hypogyna]